MSAAMRIDRYGHVQGPGRPTMSLAIGEGEWVTVCLTAPKRPDSVAGQTRQIFDAIDGFLAEAGTNKSKLLTAQVWLKNIDDLAELDAVWNDWVDRANPPVRSCIEADMARPDTFVEIRVTAAR